MPAAARTAPSPASQAPLETLRRLEWRVRHAVEGVLSGEYRSAIRGRGVEFDQVVKYTYGDDVRDIDWNVTARLGEPYRKKFIEEREVTVLVVLQDSPSLVFGSAERTRRETLLELAGVVMLLGSVNRDRVGTLHVRPDGVVLRQPVRGRNAITHAAAALLGTPDPEPVGPAPEIPWRLLAQAAPRHSVLIWLGDFAPGPEPEGWGVLRRRYQTLGFRVDDPWDRALPSHAALAAYDPQAGRLVPLDGTAAERQAHQAWMGEREARWESLFPDPLSRLVTSTQDDPLERLVRFFHARMHAGGGRGRPAP